MHEMMQEVVGVVGFDHMLRGFIGRNIDMESFGAVMIHGDQETRRRWIWMDGRL
jgi:hypothetical protein